MLREKLPVVSFQHVRISAVLEIKFTADELVLALLRVSESEPVYILDSCGVGHLGSHLLIAGLRPVEVFEVTSDDSDRTLELLDENLSKGLAAIFTLSYDLGIKLPPSVTTTHRADLAEPDLFLALFDSLLVHDYDSGRTFFVGNNEARFFEIVDLIRKHEAEAASMDAAPEKAGPVVSNFTRTEYVAAVGYIQELIRSGDTYQTNLTQQLRCNVAPGATAESVYWRLRRDHPAPFSAFLRRPSSTVVSASPERFFRTTRKGGIESSPIKGTRRRGVNVEDDLRLRAELLASAKDRAENTMIVDLVRNDLGRVCKYGSVAVKTLCEIEEHPTLFHLVSTVQGNLRNGVGFSEILRAVFPCGSITGAPKVRTMQIIDEIEDCARGLSMGAIGIYLPENWEFTGLELDSIFDLSVAIRTMVFRDGEAVFNVGGGVVIDSEPEKEFGESLLKAHALLTAIGTSYPDA